jgi:hypothetical protein
VPNQPISADRGSQTGHQSSNPPLHNFLNDTRAPTGARMASTAQEAILQKQWELGRPYYALTSHLWCHAFLSQPMGQWWWLGLQCKATRMGLFKAGNTVISVGCRNGGWIAWISALGGQVFGLEMPDLVNCISSAVLSQFPVHLALVIRLKKCDEFQNCCDEKSADQVCANVIWAWSHFHGFRPRKSTRGGRKMLRFDTEGI